MDQFDPAAIGNRIKALRKKKGYNQAELADIIGKSLRTLQKYETGEIEVSVAVVNQLAEVLGASPTYILGYETEIAPIRSMADVMNYLFHIEQVQGVDFTIDVKRPPRSREWSCALTFNGKAKDAPLNADMCLFLEEWESRRDDVRSYGISQSDYRIWKDKTLVYYASMPVDCDEPEDLPTAERIKRRKEYLNRLVEEQEGSK